MDVLNIPPDPGVTTHVLTLSGSGQKAVSILLTQRDHKQSQNTRKAVRPGKAATNYTGVSDSLQDPMTMHVCEVCVCVCVCRCIQPILPKHLHEADTSWSPHMRVAIARAARRCANFKGIGRHWLSTSLPPWPPALWRSRFPAADCPFLCILGHVACKRATRAAVWRFVMCDASS
jgi:hypothetical protein